MAKKKKTINYRMSHQERRSAVKKIKEKMKKARNEELQIHTLNRAGNSNSMETTDFKSLIGSIIKELSVIRKPDGLVIGTNEVLRLLEKEKLIAVFMFKDKASTAIKEGIMKFGKSIGVPIIRLEDKDRHILGLEFPKSITYGIKNESFPILENIRRLLLELSARSVKNNKDEINIERNNNSVSCTVISSENIKPSSTEETANQKVVHSFSFYHTHGGHVSKKSYINEEGFITLHKFSDGEQNTDFLDYDSAVCSGILTIK